MISSKRRSLGLASLFEQIVRATYDKRGPLNLQPAQWSALRYFDRAGVRARTVSGLAKYMGVTMGPASRAARALERRRLLISEKNTEDARSIVYTLTSLGQELMETDPLNRLAAAFDCLQAADLEVISRSLVNIAESLSSKNVFALDATDRRQEGG
ncbi:hypothetical protein DEA8626_03462 [Defluviimonas aquaemixtae]|uniref:HTH marR-type domain-containing protein n=1 Tax=Albidovulum aquaemixtae TaxID=1542388 RepID=A0A2R8BM46_9RHOB|nr:hypothetical protein DEA8626_03462 [Defluviimonas aquaemixtae]